ncbi:MAG: hypothetical protein ACJ8AO_19140 [Gemmatimonadaceae bacterium]
MPLWSTSRLLTLALGLAAGAALPRAGAAQKPVPEFTTQGFMVGDFESKPPSVGRKLADRVRDRVEDAFKKRDLQVIGRREMEDQLILAGYEMQSQLARTQAAALAKRLRADEYVTGTVGLSHGKYRVEGYVVLTRDTRFRQPLAPVEDASLERAADKLVAELVALRAQMTPLRRCENFQREGKYAEAMAAALPGITAYPRSTLARACYLLGLAQGGTYADSMLAIANQILALDPTNAIGLQNAAIAYDAKKDRARAGDAWRRLLATDSGSVRLTAHVVNKLAGDGNAALAYPIVEKAVATFPTDTALARLHFLVLLATERWKPAIVAGERLAALDSSATADPRYFERLAAAYRADSQPVKALAVAVRGVAAHPADADLYALYAQLVRAESEVVLPRGAQQFATSPKIQALYAQALRASGSANAVRQSLEATRRALELDPRLPRGFLQLAQLYMEAGVPDSALIALGTGVENGEDSVLVAKYALARGNALYKAAAETRQIADFQRAASFLALAERLAPTKEGRFLLGVTSFSLGQIAINDAVKTRDCAMSRLAESAFTEVEVALPTAGAVSPEAAKQMLDYVSQARPALANQLATFCQGP